MEVETECQCCGDKTPIMEGSYVVVSSTFQEVENGHQFYMSAGYNIDSAKEFVTKIRMKGEFAVMMKFEKSQDLVNPLTFRELLEVDEYE